MPDQLDEIKLDAPGGAVPYAVRQDGGTFMGVRLPSSVPFFDCRQPDDAPMVRAHYGETLWAGERAAYALGLRVGWGSHDSTPLHVHVYCDLRNPEAADETADALRSLRRGLAEAWRNYRRAKRSRYRGDHGGTSYPRPAAVELANYGGSIIADDRDRATEYFRPSRKGGR